MSVETIIAIVTSCIAFVTSVASFSYNLIQSRKDRIQKVILENRLKYLYEIREGFSEFIGLANIGAIKAANGNSEIKKAYFSSLFNGYGKMKTYLKPFYDIEKDLIKSLDALYNHILSLANGETDDAASLDTFLKDFSDKYHKYDWAYWKYIQLQKEGNYMNSDDAFDNVYYEFIEKIN